MRGVGGGVGRGLTTERCTGQEFHSLLSHIASSVEPVSVFERILLLVVDLYGMVHIMHLLCFVPVGLYYVARWLFAFLGDLST